MKSIKEKYKGELKTLLNNEKEHSEWLLTSKTLLLPKNKITNQAQNYRPIALQSTMYKVYTAILAEFIMEHCEENNIITEEQAAGKRRSWGCADQLLINKMIYDEVTSKRRNLEGVREGTRKEREEKWKRKVTHGYLQKTLSEDETIDMKKTNKWLNLHLPAHTEGYITAIQEQELDTKETRKRREKHPEKKESMDILCRVCKKAEESVYHLVCASPVMAPTLYLNIRHNQVACILYQEITGNDKMDMKPPPVTSKDQMEIWWDQQIRTITKTEKNRPDIIIWHSDRQLY